MTRDPPRAPAVIDIEASGFGRGSYPIEIGFVLADGRSDCMLIHPADDWLHWDPAAEALHRISREALATHGRPVADVAARLNRQLDGLTLYCDGWAHDFSWLAALYEAAGTQPSYRLESLTTLLGENELARWDVVKRQVFDCAPQARHRASADARLLQEALVRLHAGPGG